jgi:hypothetical protein
MKLRHRAFEKGVKERIRARIKASPELRRESGKAGQAGLHAPLGRIVWRLLIPVLLFVLLHRVRGAGGGVDALLTLMGLWSIFAICDVASDVEGQIAVSGYRMVFSGLPVLDRDVLSHLAARMLCGKWGLIFDALILQSVVVLETGVESRWVWGLVPVFAALHAAAVMISGLWLGMRFPMGFYAIITQAGIVLLIGTRFIVDRTSVPIVSIFQEAFPYLVFIPPGGWLNGLFSWCFVQGNWVGGVLLIPTVLLMVWALKMIWVMISWVNAPLESLVLGYPGDGLIEENEPTNSQDDGELQGDAWFEKDDISVEEFAALERKANRTAVFEDWQEPRMTGVVESFVMRCLNGRQRVLSIFMSAGMPGWTPSLGVLGGCLLIGAASLCLPVEFGAWLLGICGLVFLWTVFPVFGGDWSGFETVANQGLETPALAELPVGFWEMFRVAWKANVLRLMMASPLVLLFGAGIGWTWMDGRILVGLIFAAKIVWLSVAIQPVVISGLLCKGTCYSRKHRWFQGVYLFGIACALAIMIGIALGMFLADGVVGVATCSAIAMLLPWICTLPPAWAWSRGVFDMIRPES